MKKTIITSCVAMLLAFAAFAQPVSDRAVIPVAVTLNQILRVHVIDGGNIEFVFNTIGQFKSGIVNSSFYNTQVVIASSTDWELNFGAEDAALLPTDEPTHGAQLPAIMVGMPLNNVGYMITSSGANVISSTGLDPTGLGDDSDINFNGLGQFGVTLSQNPLMSSVLGVGNNGGDITDNDFTINWECGDAANLGTGAGNATNAGTILSQNIQPDRYVTNVLIDVNSL